MFKVEERYLKSISVLKICEKDPKSYIVFLVRLPRLKNFEDNR